MPKRMNMEPFDQSCGPARVCPQCGLNKPLTPQNWTGRWVEREVEGGDGVTASFGVITKVRVPTVYCRSCVNANKRNNNEVRRIIASASPAERPEMEAMTRGPCALCHKDAKRRATLARFDEVMVVCTQCRAFIFDAEQFGDPLAFAKTGASYWISHCQDEVRIATETLARTNLEYVRPHQRNPARPGAVWEYWNHLVCQSLERSWKGIMMYLVAHRDELAEQ